MSEIKKIVEGLKLKIPQLEPKDVDGSNAILLDCRDREEIELGIIKNSIWIEKGKVDLAVEDQIPDKSLPITVYCASGIRSALVAKNLLDLGYKNVSCLQGGITNWKNSGLPVSTVINSTVINRRRYLSQLRVPEIGEEGQRRIQAAKVLVIGAGGLGSPIAYYLAAAGVGTIGIVDSDVVDESNLQRQILHSTDRIGLKKVDSAFLTLKSLNPQINIETYPERFAPENADLLAQKFDLVIDGCDNFATRYLVNMACVKNRRPNIHGAVLRFQGQVSVFAHENGPCYSCVFPRSPSADLEMDCAEGGVLGATVGTVGTLMAIEAIKIILQKGRSLNGRLLAIDTFNGEIDSLNVTKDPSCEICSKPSAELNYLDLDKLIERCRLE